MVPSLNFDMVAPNVYRSGHPNNTNLKFLHKLKLKSIMYNYIIIINQLFIYRKLFTRFIKFYRKK